MEIDIKKVTVLPRNEWNRIKARLEPQTETEKRNQSIIAERERLHQKSIDTVKNWSNTIQGQRQKKLEARKLRLEAEEVELQKIDKEEAKFQQAKRREAIDKAKTLQYYETDRVKEFHGAMLLSEVLKERDQQVEMRKKIAQMQKDRESYYDSAYVGQYKNQVDNEESRRLEAKNKTLAVANYQKQQRQLKSKQLEKELKAEIALGQSYKAQDDAHKQWVKDKNEKEIGQKKALKLDILGQIEQKKRLAEFDFLQQKEEDGEIILFNQAKAALKKKRQDKEKEIQAALQEQRRVMCNKIESDNNRIDQQREIQANNVRKLKEQQDDIKAARKQLKLEKCLEEIKNHRLQEVKRLENIVLEEKLKDEENLARRIVQDNEYLTSEKKKGENKRQVAENLRDFHIKQINEMAARERLHTDRNMACDKAEKEVLMQEEEEFQKYAGEVITRAKERNVNIYPLIKAARPGAGGGHGPINKGGIRPSFMSGDSYGVQLPTYQKDSTDDVKNIYGSKHIGHAKKRFGFVW